MNIWGFPAPKHEKLPKLLLARYW